MKILGRHVPPYGEEMDIADIYAWTQGSYLLDGFNALSRLEICLLEREREREQGRERVTSSCLSTRFRPVFNS